MRNHRLIQGFVFSTQAGGTAGVAGMSVASSTAGAHATGGTAAVQTVFGTLNESCAPRRALACPDTGDDTLVCGEAGTWEQSTASCASGTRCDPRPGTTAGTCQPYDVKCTGPGAVYCGTDDNLWVCDEGGMTASQKEVCPLGCWGQLQCMPVTGKVKTSLYCDTSPFEPALPECQYVPGATPLGLSLVSYWAAASDSGPDTITFGVRSGNTRHIESYCEGSVAWRAVELAVGYPTPVSRIRSVAPWYIKTYIVSDDGDKTLCTTTDTATCIVAPAGHSTGFWVYTDDPNADTSNVVVEFNLENPTCP